MKLFISCRTEDADQVRAIIEAVSPESKEINRYLYRRRDHDLAMCVRATYALEDEQDIVNADLVIILGNPPHVRAEMTERDVHMRIAYQHKSAKKIVLLGHKPVSDLWCLLEVNGARRIEAWDDMYLDEIRGLTKFIKIKRCAIVEVEKIQIQVELTVERDTGKVVKVELVQERIGGDEVVLSST